MTHRCHHSPFPSFKGCEACRAQLGGYRRQGRPHKRETRTVRRSRAPTMLPLTPPTPPQYRSPAHDNDSHPNPHSNGDDTTTDPTTHHTSTTAAAACPRTQHTAHPPQPPQTRHVTRRGSTHNNDGHPSPHPNGKDTTTGPTAHHTPRTTTHNHCHCLSRDTAHGPAAPTVSSHGKPTPAPTTSNGHDTSKAHAGQVPTAPHTHAHATQPQHNSRPTVQTTDMAPP
jgi:hypothetical protein